MKYRTARNSSYTLRREIQLLSPGRAFAPIVQVMGHRYPGRFTFIVGTGAEGRPRRPASPIRGEPVESRAQLDAYILLLAATAGGIIS